MRKHGAEVPNAEQAFGERMAGKRMAGAQFRHTVMFSLWVGRLAPWLIGQQAGTTDEISVGSGDLIWE